MLNRILPRAVLLAAFLCLGPTMALQAWSSDAVKCWQAQTIYVPIYSHIYADERFKDKPFALTATLSIRNIDPDRPLTLLAADFHDSAGRKLHAYVDSPRLIAPLASVRFVVRENGPQGGSGAKFLVRWQADRPVVAPIVESIMIGTKMQQGISFISRGRVIRGQQADCR
ncbi:DUF3124 domain-containing protein [Thermodesulfobacteriota bacterium B35]